MVLAGNPNLVLGAQKREQCDGLDDTDSDHLPSPTFERSMASPDGYVLTKSEAEVPISTSAIQQESLSNYTRTDCMMQHFLPHVDRLWMYNTAANHLKQLSLQ